MLVEKMIRAAKLDPNLYEEVEADTQATPEALRVVLLSSIAGGVGVGSATLTQWGIGEILLSILVGSLSTMAAWAIWAYLTYIIGTKIFPGPDTRSSFGELLRTIGFSSSPGIIRFLGLITPINWLSFLFLISAAWSLATMVVAVRQALDFTTGRAIATCLVGWIIQALFLAFLLALFR